MVHAKAAGKVQLLVSLIEIVIGQEQRVAELGIREKQKGRVITAADEAALKQGRPARLAVSYGQEANVGSAAERARPDQWRKCADGNIRKERIDGRRESIA